MYPYSRSAQRQLACFYPSSEMEPEAKHLLLFHLLGCHSPQLLPLQRTGFVEHANAVTAAVLSLLLLRPAVSTPLEASPLTA
jgi:hypothetical protein